MICPHCHTENREGAKFCNECGARLDAPAAPAVSGPLDPSSIPAIKVAGLNVDEEGNAFRFGPDDEFDADDATVAEEIAEEIEDADAGEGEEADEMPGDDDAAGAAPAEEDERADGDGACASAADEGAGEVVSASAEDGAPDAASAAGEAANAPAPIEGDAPAAADAGAPAAPERAHAPASDAADPTAVIAPRAADAGKTAVIGARPADFAPTPVAPAPGVDLSGLDEYNEYVINPGYVPPRGAWRSGDTMEMPRIESAPAPQKHDYRAPDANKRSRGGKIAAGIAVVLLLAALVAAGTTYYFELWGGSTVPDVVGMTQTDAAYALENKGFTVQTTLVASDDVEGVVLSMDPASGAREAEGTSITLSVSQARTVPDLSKMTQDQAAAALAAAGYTNVAFAAQPSDEAEGTVLGVTPAAGERAAAGDAVTVTVAAPYTVPDVSNMTYDEAASAIEAAGLVAERVSVYDDSVAEGTVLATDPQAGAKVSSGSTVAVSVSRSRGTELVAAAKSFLGAGSFNANGTTYAVTSVDSVSYSGNNTTAFTVTASAVTTLDGETVHGSPRQRTGTIVWTDDNYITSITLS